MLYSLYFKEPNFFRSLDLLGDFEDVSNISLCTYRNTTYVRQFCGEI